MPSFTGTVRFSGGGDTIFSQGIPMNALTGHPYLTHGAFLALFNPVGSGKNIRLTGMETELGGFSYSTVTEFIRGNIPTWSDTPTSLTVVPADSSAPSFPGDVKISSTSITGTTFMKEHPYSSCNLAWWASGSYAFLYGLNPPKMRVGNSTEQGIVIKPGQDLMLYHGAAFVFEANYDTEIYLSSGGYDYTCVFNAAMYDSYGHSTNAHLHITNPSDSTSDITYVGWRRMPMSASSATAFDGASVKIKAYIITGYEQIPGYFSSVSVTSLDSNSTNSAELVKNACVYLDGSNRGAVISEPALLAVHPQPNSLIRTNLNWAGLGGMMTSGRFAGRQMHKGNIVLHEGEGIALVLGQNDNRVILQQTTLYWDEQSVSGNTYSRSRVVNA